VVAVVVQLIFEQVTRSHRESLWLGPLEDQHNHKGTPVATPLVGAARVVAQPAELPSPQMGDLALRARKVQVARKQEALDLMAHLALVELVHMLAQRQSLLTVAVVAVVVTTAVVVEMPTRVGPLAVVVVLLMERIHDSPKRQITKGSTVRPDS